MYGYGALLRIDLTNQKISRENLPREWCERWIGGEGMNDWLLWEHFLKHDPRIDPRGPENVMIVGLGPLGASGIGMGTKGKFTFKSPCYHMFADSVSGGTFHANLRWAGYDYLVITGQAAKPIYIWVDNDRVELRDASSYWGKNAREANELIKKELGDEQIHTVTIGIAGENLVEIANLLVSGERAGGRCGGGCVLGSKKVKAIAARGTRGLSVYDPEGFANSITDFQTKIDRPGYDGWKKEGTLLAINMYQNIGSHSFRNNQDRSLPPDSLEALNGDTYHARFHRRSTACSPSCFMSCTGYTKIEGHESSLAPQYRGDYRRPEYLTVASYGMNCDVRDLSAVTYLGIMSDDYAMDILELGAIGGFLMELWQRGLLSARETAELFDKPVSLEWGDISALEEIIQSIALQKNKVGEIFRDGVFRGARRLEQLKGIPLLKYALYGKGGSTFLEESRPFPTWMCNMAVASRGADHLKGLGFMDKMERKDVSMEFFGRPEAGERFTPTLKGAASALLENQLTVINSLGVCVFAYFLEPTLFPMDLWAQAYTRVTGIEMSGKQMRLIGERVYNMEKAFNSRLGMRREHDTICERWMKEPAPKGPGEGMKGEDYMEQVLDEYYEYRGWDKRTSLQTRKKLEELGLPDVAEVLARENALIS